MLNFNKEKKMKKEDKIKEIRRLAEQELPAMIKNCQVNPDNTELQMMFEKAKLSMTMLIIETSIGAYSVQKEGDTEWKYVFTQKLPDFGDINEICDIIEKYYKQYERPYIQVTDMNIPANVTVDKVTKKSLTNGINDYLNKYQVIDRSVVMSLAEYGQKLRRKQNITTSIIVGGIALAIVGGVITGAVLYNKKKSDSIPEDDIDIEIDNIDVDTSDIEVPVIEEVPVVEID